MSIIKQLLLLALLLLNPLYGFNTSWSGQNPFASNDSGSEGECDGSACEGKEDCNRNGSPIYLKTGHFTWSETDIVLAGTPSLSLTRNYTSHEPRVGLFGNGWISNLERALVKTIKTKNIQTESLDTDGKGRELKFFYNSKGYIEEVRDHTQRSWLYIVFKIICV